MVPLCCGCGGGGGGGGTTGGHDAAAKSAQLNICRLFVHLNQNETLNEDGRGVKSVQELKRMGHFRQSGSPSAAQEKREWEKGEDGAEDAENSGTKGLGVKGYASS